MELDELREDLKRQRSDIVAAMLSQKVLTESHIQKLAVIQTAIEAVSTVIATGGLHAASPEVTNNMLSRR